MSKHNGQLPINPNGAGRPSTTGGKSGGSRGGNQPKGNNLSPASRSESF